MKLRGLVPNSYIHLSVSEFYTLFPRSVCRKIGGLIVGIYKSLTDTLMWNWEYINRILFAVQNLAKLLVTQTQK
jgi:hypothetical protein